jgi:hypothetical protein
MLLTLSLGFAEMTAKEFEKNGKNRFDKQLKILI